MLDETCPECGRPLRRKFGRFGPFVGCSGYPDCKYIKKDPPKSTGIPVLSASRARSSRGGQGSG